jgi:hypothetical protein
MEVIGMRVENKKGAVHLLSFQLALQVHLPTKMSLNSMRVLTDSYIAVMKRYLLSIWETGHRE